jgi:hypothetical protein
MPKGVFVAITNPVSPEREAEYNEWYEGTHIHEVLAVDGFKSARRYKAVDGESPRYMAVYEVEADDLGAMMQKLMAAGQAGKLTQSDASDRSLTSTRTYELISEATR